MTEPGLRRASDLGRVVAFRLTVCADDPFAGTVLVEGEPDPLLFTGWIELMAAINDARLHANSHSDVL